jgi:hypothetical protein
MTQKKSKLWYWSLTVLLTLALLMSAIPSALALDYAVEHFTKHLGYPEYFLQFTGFTKIIGLIALYIPGHNRIKEWVYAGLLFDLVGAIYSSIAVGDTFLQWFPIGIDLVLLVITYILFRKIFSKEKAITRQHSMLARQ